MRRYVCEEEGERFFQSNVELVQFLDDLHNIVGDMNQCFIRKVKPAELSPHFVTCGLFRKGVNLLHSIEILLRHGYAYEAAILCRTLLETMTHVRYILKDDAQIDTRAKEYLAFVRTRMADIIRKVEENPLLHDFLPGEVRATIKARAEEVKAGFTERPEILRKLFGLDTLEKEMDLVGLSIHYDLSYKHLSQYSHAQDVFSHITLNPKERGIVSPSCAPDQIFRLVLHTATGAFLTLMADVDLFLKCGYGDLLRTYLDLWARLSGAEPTSAQGNPGVQTNSDLQ